MFSELSKLTSIPESLLIAAMALLAIATVGLIVWWLYKISHPTEEQRLEKILAQNSLAVEKGVILSDGLYGYHFIDFLVLFPKKIMVLVIHHSDGYIFGGEHMEQWAQVLHQKSYKFDNPLNRVNHFVHTVNEIVDAGDVIGRVVFTGDNSFPKGVPERVLDKDSLVDSLQAIRDEQIADSDQVRRAWSELLQISREHRQQYRRDL